MSLAADFRNRVPLVIRAIAGRRLADSHGHLAYGNDDAAGTDAYSRKLLHCGYLGI